MFTSITFFNANDLAENYLFSIYSMHMFLFYSSGLFYSIYIFVIVIFYFFYFIFVIFILFCYNDYALILSTITQDNIYILFLYVLVFFFPCTAI